MWKTRHIQHTQPWSANLHRQLVWAAYRSLLCAWHLLSDPILNMSAFSYLSVSSFRFLFHTLNQSVNLIIDVSFQQQGPLHSVASMKSKHESAHSSSKYRGKLHTQMNQNVLWVSVFTEESFTEFQRKKMCRHDSCFVLIATSVFMVTLMCATGDD